MGRHGVGGEPETSRRVAAVPSAGLGDHSWSEERPSPTWRLIGRSGEPSARVAAIDCGTNSIRLLVADLTLIDGAVKLTDVHREMRVVRLGEGVDATGRLSGAAIDRTWSALADYTAILRSHGAVDVRMAATSATRDAANRADFVEMVRSTLGQEPEVITGEEEAELSFRGAVGDLDPTEGPFLVVDIGGGSTEMVVGSVGPRGISIAGSLSLDIGCVRITERLLHGDPPTTAERGRGHPVDDVGAVGRAGSVADPDGAAAGAGVRHGYHRRCRGPPFADLRPRAHPSGPDSVGPGPRRRRSAVVRHPGPSGRVGVHASGPGRRDRRGGAGALHPGVVGPVPGRIDLCGRDHCLRARHPGWARALSGLTRYAVRRRRRCGFGGLVSNPWC